MKLKKILATTLAVAMAVIAIPATTAHAEWVDSQTAYITQEVYKVTLPTTAGQKFYLDPQGLTSIAKTGTLDPNAKGQVIGATTMTAINKSSKQVILKINANMVVSGGGADIATSTTQAITELNSPSTKPAICLYTQSTVSNKTVTGAALMTVGQSQNKIIAETPGGVTTSFDYTLADGVYEAVTKSAIDTSDLDALYNPKNYDYKMVESGGALNIRLFGTCSPNGDYTSITSGETQVLLDMVFKMYKADGTTKVGDSFSYISSNGNYAFDVTDGSLSGLSITACTMDDVDGIAAVNNGKIALVSTGDINRIVIAGSAPFVTAMNPGETHVFKFTISDGRTYTITMVKQ